MTIGRSIIPVTSPLNGKSFRASRYEKGIAAIAKSPVAAIDDGVVRLIAEDPVSGISQHEALAYANWVSGQDDELLKGAVVQHEYQWEVAVRTQAIKEFGRVWEWCSNPFHPYTGYQPAEDGLLSTGKFDQDWISLRGSSIYTQTSLRRPSYRNHSTATSRHGFTGTRLVFPPIK